MCVTKHVSAISTERLLSMTSDSSLESETSSGSYYTANSKAPVTILSGTDEDSGQPSNRTNDRSKQHQKRVSPDFSALITNVDQLPNKLNELKSVIYSKNYDLVLLTEVCPESSSNRLQDSQVKIPGYGVVSNLQSPECRRGILVLFKTCYSIRSLCLPGNSQFVESVWFDLCDNGSGVRTRVGCIYKAHLP
jgi:hypothetical protein